MARERHVFPTGEIYHKWAHQTQGDARNPQGNLSFRGPALYSYRTCVAYLHKHKTRGTLALISEHRYSATTAGHLSDARRATSHLAAIEVPDVDPTKTWIKGPFALHADNIKFLTNGAARLLAEAGRAMSPPAVSWRRNGAQRALHNAEAYSRFFRLPDTVMLRIFGIRRKVPDFPAAAWDAAAARAERIANPDPASADARERASARRKAGSFARIEYLVAQRDSIRAAREAAAFYPNMARRSNWRLGSPWDLGYFRLPDTVMLRINGEDIETSLGARVPLAAAPLLWHKIERSRKAGGWTPSGLSVFKVGDYPITAIDGDGTLHAGCHHIPHSELRAMARALNLT